MKRELEQEDISASTLSPSAPDLMEQREEWRSSKQSLVLLRYWTKGKKRSTFILHFVQHIFLITIIFTSTTIFTNYNIVFGHISSLLSQGQTVSLSSGSQPVSSISISQVNWSQISSSLAQTVFTNESGYLVSEMNKIMLITGIITVGLLILRESWSTFHESRLMFLQLELPIRSVLYHGASHRAVISFDLIMGVLQATVSYVVGALIAVFLVIPLIESVVHDTFLDFLVSSIPVIPYLVALLPVALTLMISFLYFVLRIRNVKLN